MQIPIDTPIGFIGLLMLVVGLFLLLTGFSILKVQKVTVKPGKNTWGIGLIFTLIGLALVVVGDPVASPPPSTVTVPPQTELPTSVILPAATQPLLSPIAGSSTDPYLLLATASNWPLTESEDFEDPDPRWNGFATYSDDVVKHNMRFEGGRLLWGLEVLAPGGYWYWEATPYFSYSDFYLSMKFKRNAEPVNPANYGLIFRKQGNRDYMFRINDSQRFSVFLYDLDTWIELIGWTKEETIQPGRFNELTVIAIGDTMTFFINQKYVGAIVDASLDKGEIAFMVSLAESSAEVLFEFDDFVLRVMP